jgi:hypothetical protein
MFVAKIRYFRHSCLFLPKYIKPLELCAPNNSLDINNPTHNPYNPLNECEKTLVCRQALNCKDITDCAFSDRISQCHYTNPLNECEKTKTNK